MQGRVHSIETFGAVDGPGIRFVVFLQGCPMRCLYCHNPDTWQADAGQTMSVQDLLVEIKKYKNYFGSEGGVTVSGGEPLMQIDFVIELFRALKKDKIHTCIDTSGILFRNEKGVKKKYDELMKYTDLVLLDLKQINEQKHQILTGHINQNILDFAHYLDAKKIPVWVRFVLVPTVTDDITDIKKLKEFIDALKNVVKIEVLPYHTMGEKKYAELQIDYRLKGIPTPTKEQIATVEQILKGDNK